MDAHLFLANQMSYQQQFLNNRAANNRSHYSNRQLQQVNALADHHRRPPPAASLDRHHQQPPAKPASGSSGSDQEERAVQLSSINSTTTSKTTSSSQAAMLGAGKTSGQMQREHMMMQHQRARAQQQQQPAGPGHRQAALQSHTLTGPLAGSKPAPAKSQTTGSNLDQLTTSSSDHTLDDLHQLAGHGYSSHRLAHHNRPFAADHSQGPGGASGQPGGRFLLGVLFTLAELLLFATVLLWLYWAYQHDDGLAWQSDRKQQFNTHAALMLVGFIFLSGQAMLIHRSFQCCSKIYTKILHTILFVLATSAISLGLILGYTAQENVGPNNKPIMHFYSLHAWIGLTTVALFCLQFAFGFVSFLVLLCCDQATSRYRAALLPIHKTFGLIIFSLAIATCLTGLLQTARSRLRVDYHELAESGIVINLVGVCLICLAILMPYIIRNLDIKRPFRSELDRHLNKLSQLEMRI